MNGKDLKTLISGGTILIAFILFVIFSDSTPKEVLDDIKDSVSTEQVSDFTAKEIEGEISVSYAEKATGNKAQTVEYISANDGDTFSVLLDGNKQKVRLLMIDTPEMNYDENDPMPYAEDAKDYTVNILSNAKTIQVLFDKGPATDNYDRNLAYVFVDGVLLQESLLKEGLAAVRYVNKPNNTLESELRDIQADTEKKGINIWSIDGYFENNKFQDVK